MNPFDIAILVILLAFVAKGLLRGLLKEVCSLLGLFAGGWLAFYFHPAVAQWLTESFTVPAQLAVIVAFISLFLGTVIVFGVIGFLLSKFVSLVFLGGINRLFGGLFGLVQGVILLAVILYALNLPAGQKYLPQAVVQTIKGSQLAPPFMSLGRSVFTGGMKVFAGK